MGSPLRLRRRVAVPAALLVAAAAGHLLLAPRDEPSARALPRAWELADAADAAALAARPSDDDAILRPARSLRAKRRMPHGEFVHYFAPDAPRREALRAALPCDGPRRVRWWRDVDYRQPGLCGGAKCFFQSLCDPARGYLVQAGDKPHSYDVARELEAEHGIKHFYAAPPFAAGWSVPRFVERLTDGYVQFYKGAKELVVQPTIAAPEGSMVVRCFRPRSKWLTGRLERVLFGTDDAAKRRLIGDLEHAMEVTKAKPELINDFQLMVDPEGNAYHLDLDRVQRGMPTKKDRDLFEGCLEDAIKLVSALEYNDEDAKAKLRKKVKQWDARLSVNKAAVWKKGMTWRPPVASAPRKAFSSIRIY